MERLWRSMTYDDVYLRAHEPVTAVRAGLTRDFSCVNHGRPHIAQSGRTPDNAYTTARPNPSAVSTRARVPRRAA